jgi:hypothetical protein
MGSPERGDRSEVQNRVSRTTSQWVGPLPGGLLTHSPVAAIFCSTQMAIVIGHPCGAATLEPQPHVQLLVVRNETYLFDPFTQELRLLCVLAAVGFAVGGAV